MSKNNIQYDELIEGTLKILMLKKKHCKENYLN